jgi:hypothetical protein
MSPSISPNLSATVGALERRSECMKLAVEMPADQLVIGKINELLAVNLL